MTALELADELDHTSDLGEFKHYEAATLLRRQHEAIVKLRAALADTAQSIAWLEFGECRGFTESMPLPTVIAVKLAKQALKDTEEIAK